MTMSWPTFPDDETVACDAALTDVARHVYQCAAFDVDVWSFVGPARQAQLVEHCRVAWLGAVSAGDLQRDPEAKEAVWVKVYLADVDEAAGRMLALPHTNTAKLAILRPAPIVVADLIGPAIDDGEQVVGLYLLFARSALETLCLDTPWPTSPDNAGDVE